MRTPGPPGTGCRPSSSGSRSPAAACSTRGRGAPTRSGPTAEVQRGLDQILKLGGVPKDLGLGLVDFLHLRHGEEVNLCWKLGEREIRHWHGLDEGYTGRKPL